jgi:hypothetical protein
MRIARVTAAAVAIGASAFWLDGADAQLGLYQLPQSNFIWRWGSSREGEQHGIPDFEISGSEASFNCDLTARLRISSNMSSSDVRDLENNLRTRLDFIYAAATTMNSLDQSFALDWATLDCKKPEGKQLDEEQTKAREDAAREKMMKEVERRRARQQRDN